MTRSLPARDRPGPAIAVAEGEEGPRGILIVAGEASGDALGAGLVRAAHRIDPSVRFWGIGGRAMKEAGVRLVFDAGEIAVVGLWEVLSRLPRILEARRRLRDGLASSRPDRVVLIDYPDFNLRFARDVRRTGIPLFYFVSPQVWAWRPGRIATIARLVDHMMVVFPFEVEIYRKAGVPVTFVGHPLVDSEPPILDRTEARARLGLGSEGRVLALLPGSRTGEVSRLLPVQLAAAAHLRASRPDLAIVIPVASTVPPEIVAAIVASAGAAGWARPVHGLFHEALDAADAAVVASGTATLQTGYRGTPMVVVYRIHPATAWLGRRLVRISNIALVNLVAGRTIVSELVQEACTPERIAEAVAPLLDDHVVAQRIRTELAEVRSKLGAPGAFDRAARLVLAAGGTSRSGRDAKV